MTSRNSTAPQGAGVGAGHGSPGATVDGWLGQVHFGDCLDVLADAPEDSVHLIVTSPPYADRRRHTYGGVPPEEYVDWWMARAEQMSRVLAPDGSLVLNIKEGTADGCRLDYVLRLVLAMSDAGWMWREEYVWHKTCTIPGRWSHRFRDTWERCLHFSRERDIKWRPERVLVPAAESTLARFEQAKRLEADRGRVESATGSGFGKNLVKATANEMVQPSNVLVGPAVTSGTDGHSAAYPEWLPRWFIRLLSDPGDTVLDPFLGSGTTFRVAAELGRVPVGVEIHRDTPMRLTPAATELPLP